MVQLIPKYAEPWPASRLLSVENLLERLEADPHNLLRNADFRAATYVDASTGRFPYWTPSNESLYPPDGDTPRRMLLPPSGGVYQDVLGAQGSWLVALPKLVAVLVSFASSAGRLRVSVAHTLDTLDEGDYMEVRASTAPNAYQLAYMVAAPDNGVFGTASAARVRLTNIGTVDAYVDYAHLGFGAMVPQVLPPRAAAGGGAVWLGCYDADAGTRDAASGARLLRIEDMRITTSSASAQASGTVDLAAAFPGGAFVSGDQVVARANPDITSTASVLTRLAGLSCSLSGSTLTVQADSIAGANFPNGTLVCSVLVAVFPRPAAVASRGASKRAYPY